jgi:hypothetical protein
VGRRERHEQYEARSRKEGWGGAFVADG